MRLSSGILLIGALLVGVLSSGDIVRHCMAQSATASMTLTENTTPTRTPTPPPTTEEEAGPVVQWRLDPLVYSTREVLAHTFVASFDAYLFSLAQWDAQKFSETLLQLLANVSKRTNSTNRQLPEYPQWFDNRTLPTADTSNGTSSTTTQNGTNSSATSTIETETDPADFAQRVVETAACFTSSDSVSAASTLVRQGVCYDGECERKSNIPCSVPGVTECACSTRHPIVPPAARDDAIPTASTLVDAAGAPVQTELACFPLFLRQLGGGLIPPAQFYDAEGNIRFQVALPNGTVVRCRINVDGSSRRGFKTAAKHEGSPRVQGSQYHVRGFQQASASGALRVDVALNISAAHNFVPTSLSDITRAYDELRDVLVSMLYERSIVWDFFIDPSSITVTTLSSLSTPSPHPQPQPSVLTSYSATVSAGNASLSAPATISAASPTVTGSPSASLHNETDEDEPEPTIPAPSSTPTPTSKATNTPKPTVQQQEAAAGDSGPSLYYLFFLLLLLVPLLAFGIYKFVQWLKRRQYCEEEFTFTDVVVGDDGTDKLAVSATMRTPSPAPWSGGLSVGAAAAATVMTPNQMSRMLGDGSWAAHSSSNTVHPESKAAVSPEFRGFADEVSQPEFPGDATDAAAASVTDVNPLFEEYGGTTEMRELPRAGSKSASSKLTSHGRQGVADDATDTAKAEASAVTAAATHSSQKMQSLEMLQSMAQSSRAAHGATTSVFLKCVSTHQERKQRDADSSRGVGLVTDDDDDAQIEDDDGTDEEDQQDEEELAEDDDNMDLR